MTLTNEDLLAFSQLLDVKLDARLKPIENHLERIENRMNNIENRMDRIESRMDRIESRMDTLEGQVQELQNQMNNLERRMDSLEGQVQYIRADILENQVMPRLNTIESCYIDTFNRYRDYTDRMEAVFADTELLKKVVSEHSESIQKLA